MRDPLRRTLLWLSCVAWSLTLAPVSAQDAAALDRAVQVATGGAFWGTVLVAKDGEVLLVKGYGSADYAQTPNAPDTLFELASTSKQFTATCVVKLQSQGKLRVSDPITRFFPEAPKDKQAVTVAHLLRHTAGLSSELSLPYGWSGDRAEFVRRALGPPLVAEPGQEFVYSNVGYALLAAIVEEASGQSFEDYARTELFEPAGLVDTGFVGDERLVGSERASVRWDSEDSSLGGGSAADWPYGWGYRGMGGVVSTAEDMLRWDRALRSDAVLDAEARAELFRPGLRGYACGWFVTQSSRGTTRVEHGGSVHGYEIGLVRFLEEDTLICVLSNGKTETPNVVAALERSLFPPPRLVARFDLSPYEPGESGAYQLETPVELEVGPAAEGGGQVVLKVLDPARDHCVVELDLPRAGLGHAISGLEAALAGKEASSARALPALGAYIQRYPLDDATLVLEGELTLTFMPEYRSQTEAGEPVHDGRLILILDHRDRFWPLMLPLELKAARSLASALRELQGR